MRAGIAFGSNVGDRLKLLRQARTCVLASPVLAPPILMSSIYLTSPVDCPPVPVLSSTPSLRRS